MSSAAVPVKKHSSALYRSVRDEVLLAHRVAGSRASVMTVLRVMPSRQPAEVGGVVSMPSRTMKTFSPDPSVMKPASFSMMASS